MKRRKPKRLVPARWRSHAVLAAFAMAALGLEARVVYLQLVDREFLSAQGERRHIRTVQISAHRGAITDRHGEPLAVSTPVNSIWADPTETRAAFDRLEELAQVLDVDPEWLARRITSNLDREFVYLKRHLSPAEAADVLQLDVPGVRSLREYRRYYPAGEVTGHVIGFTDIDDSGQEGIEYAFDYWLTGEPGAKRVLQDQLGRVIGDVEQVAQASPGRELRTSIDLRLQYLAYRELKAAVVESRAPSGSAVILDARTGEVLAMVNQPSFNPNDRSQRDASHYRNRAVTDPLEPGSAVKPFVLAAALESGRFDPSTIVDTGDGYLEIDGDIVTEDPSRLGRITVTDVLAKSSNVGMAKIALELTADEMWRSLTAFGIGRPTASGFPGESAGALYDAEHWGSIAQATHSYGYGLSVTALQLARAYAAIASGGLLPAISFVALSEPPEMQRVIDAETAAELLAMLEVVVSPQGTGQRAAVGNYRIAGKTGTARISERGRYSDDRYHAVFAGIAPASDPRLVTVIVVNDPRGADYYGGDVAAPIFSQVMADALRVLAVPPDDLLDPGAILLTRAEASP